jgi:hypothetical protein
MWLGHRVINLTTNIIVQKNIKFHLFSHYISIKLLFPYLSGGCGWIYFQGNLATGVQTIKKYTKS